ncbi:MAG: hypothetical protein IPM35_38990 [Myxococcales bacterium]|nr:hypothetical protein [Myxococcales bacterium]
MASVRILLWSVGALVVACGLEQGGEASSDSDGGAGTGGSVSSTGGAWSSGGAAGADASLGGAAGSSPDAAAGSAGAAGAAGAGGTTAAGGAAGAGGLGTGGGGAACSAPATTCSGDLACCSGLCGPSVGADVNDCITPGKCAECDDDLACASGRCDACKCEPQQIPGANCNEKSDCVSDLCGPRPIADVNDCNTYGKCAECDDDGACMSGRCDACKCEPKQAFGAACNEESDCTSDLCGPKGAPDASDCNVYGKCAECDDDVACASGRCDACKCEPKLANGAGCNEDSDCTNGWCSAGKCK